MIDVNASVGEWPFGPLAHNTPAGLLKWLAPAGIERACVAPLEGLFYRDVQQANARMHRALGRRRDRLLPFCVVNPAWPDWQADLRQCREEYGAAGVRLFPAHHGYRLADPCCAELLEALQDAALPVQIAPVISDPRMHHPLAHVPAASLDGVLDVAGRFPRLNIALLNVRVEVEPALQDAAAVRGRRNLFFDIAWVDGLGQVAALVDRLGDENMLLGTNAPLMIPVSALYKLSEADLSREQVERITRGNALRFLGQEAAGRIES